MDSFLSAHPEVNAAVAFALKEVADVRPEDPVSLLAEKLSEFNALNRSGEAESKEDGKDADEEEAARIREMQKRRGGRRSCVFAEPVKLEAGWKPRVVEKTDAEKASIHAVILKNILFASMDEDQRGIIVDAMEKKNFSKDDVIIKQGDMGDFYYVLASGTCDIFKDGVLVLQYSEGMGFGELALMYDAPRAATVKATSEVETWAIDRQSFKQVMMGTTTRKRAMYQDFLEAVPILSVLSPEERLTIADALVTVTFEAGDVVVREGDTNADRFYIVEDGELKGTKEDVEGEVCPRLGRGSYFGEIALVLDKPRAATISAVTKTKCAAMDRAAFYRLLGPIKELVRRNMDLYSKYETDLKRVPSTMNAGAQSDDED